MGTTRARLRPPSPALILACVALFAALGGGAYAASSTGSKGIHFTNAHLINGWQAGNTTNKVDAPPSYAKDSLGVVHLRGVLFGADDKTAFVLPKGLRPSHFVETLIFTQSGVAGGVEIDKHGNVIPFGGNDSAFTSLDGVTFVAGQ